LHSFPYLPHFPLANWQLLVSAVLLLLGYGGGEVSRRIGLPRVLGYVCVGAILGDPGIGIINEGVRNDLRLFIDVGLGMLLYEMGQRLDLDWMRRERWLWVTAVAEMVLTWLLVFFVLTLFHHSTLEASLLAAVVISSSPVLVMYMVRDLGADGQVTSRIVTLSALNSMAAFVISATLLSWVHYSHEGGVPTVLFHSVYLLLGSFALGMVVFALYHSLARWFGKGDAPQLVLAISMVLLGVGLADALNLSVLCTLLTVGVLAKNANPRRFIRHIEFGVTAELFCVILFVSAGAAWHFSWDSSTLWTVAALIGARYLGKALPIYGLAALTPLGLSRAGLVALGLTPLSGFTALLVLDTTNQYHLFAPRLLDVFLSSVVILEIAGPLLLQVALRQAREVTPQT
jgi:Kef-type K+ transport system membrane component KefB